MKVFYAISRQQAYRLVTIRLTGYNAVVVYQGDGNAMTL